MNAFIPLSKYIVKETTVFGAGVSVCLTEEAVMDETERRKNVESDNVWLSITIPERDEMLDSEKNIMEQPDKIKNYLKSKDFITTLFVKDGRKLLENNTQKTEWDIRYQDFLSEKYRLLLSLPSGLDLINFINERCNTHDMGKSSALLYSSGIKGSIFQEKNRGKIMIFNAQKDISVLKMFGKSLGNTSQIL